MVSKNDITGDDIKSGFNSEAYKDSWERIFGKKKTLPEEVDAAWAEVDKEMEGVDFTDTKGMDDILLTEEIPPNGLRDLIIAELAFNAVNADKLPDTPSTNDHGITGYQK